MVEARNKLTGQKISSRIVSLPRWELFDAQPEEYRHSVLPPSVRVRIAAEAGVTQGWHRYVGDQGDVIGVNRFGASGPGSVVMGECSFTVDNVLKRTLALLRKQED
jgi:transketolase